jgi:hypothetical protein
MENINTFLNTHNFELIEQKSSTNFGDQSKVFSDNNMCIRISTIRSVFTIDACNFEDNDNWFDLALLKALLYNEKQLNKPLNKTDYLTFLENEIDVIKKLFVLPNYSLIKLKLHELEKLRVKQMFPNLNR